MYNEFLGKISSSLVQNTFNSASKTASDILHIVLGLPPPAYVDGLLELRHTVVSHGDYVPHHSRPDRKIQGIYVGRVGVPNVRGAKI